MSTHIEDSKESRPLSIRQESSDFWICLCTAPTRGFIRSLQVNCLTEICFEEALSTAKDLDAHFEKTGKPVGPLHGLPVSIKDNFKIKGLDSTLGFACWSVSLSVRSLAAQRHFSPSLLITSTACLISTGPTIQ